MWSDVVAATTWALLWLLLVSAIFAWLARRVMGEEKRPLPDLSRHIPPWLFVILLAMIVRLIPMLLLPVGAGYDIKSFQLVGEALINNQEVYTSAAIGRHPYLPFQLYLIGLLFNLSQRWGLPFVIFVKIPGVLADIGMTWLIFRVGKSRGWPTPRSVKRALLYAFNPISILVSAYHGQFDAVPVFLLLLAWHVWANYQHTRRSALILGMAILSKTWPVVFLPIILLRLKSKSKQLLYGSLAIAVPIAATIFYIWLFQSDPRPMLQRALTHSGVPGYYGYSALLAVLGGDAPWYEAVFTAIVQNIRWVLVGAGLITVWLTRKQATLDALTTTLLTIFVLTAGMGIQWFVWLVPVALLAGDIRWLGHYTWAGAVFLLVQLYGLHMYPWLFQWFDKETADTLFRVGSLPAWLVVIAWTGVRWKRLLSTGPTPVR